MLMVTSDGEKSANDAPIFDSYGPVIDGAGHSEVVDVGVLHIEERGFEGFIGIIVDRERLAVAEDDTAWVFRIDESVRVFAKIGKLRVWFEDAVLDVDRGTAALFLSSFQFFNAFGEVGECSKAVEGVGASVERVNVGRRTRIFVIFFADIGKLHHLMLGDADGGHVLQVEEAERGGSIAQPTPAVVDAIQGIAHPIGVHEFHGDGYAKDGAKQAGPEILAAFHCLGFREVDVVHRCSVVLSKSQR